MNGWKVLGVVAIAVAFIAFFGCGPSSPNPSDSGIPDIGFPDGGVIIKSCTAVDVPGVSNTSQWTSITASSDGTKLAAAVGGNGNSGYIYTSTDSGATWTERTSAGNRYWYSIASSSDGT